MLIAMRIPSAGDLGVSEVPMRLLITAVITSLALPVFWGAYEDLSERMTMIAVEEEVSSLLKKIDDVLSGGKGSSLDLILDLDSWGFGRLESVKIGGPGNGTDPSAYMVRYSIKGLGSSFMSLDPPQKIVSEDGSGLELQEGSHELRITKVELVSGEIAALIELL